MKAAHPSVSIGLPVYNGAALLGATFDALLAQTFPDFEVIVCDNASTDATAELCQAYAAQDSRIRYYRNATNVGASRNHTLAANLATGEYFKWCGHDDLYAPTYLAECIDVLATLPGVVLCYPRAAIIDDDGLYVSSYQDHFHLVGVTPEERYRRVLEHSNQELLNPSLGLIRTTALKRTMPVGNYYASDRVILAQLAIDGEFFEVASELFFRRVYNHKVNWTTGTDEQVTEWFDPAAKSGIVAPRAKKLYGYLRAIDRSTQPLAVKRACYRVLAEFYMSGERSSGLQMEARTLRQSLRKLLPNR